MTVKPDAKMSSQDMYFQGYPFSVYRALPELAEFVRERERK